MAIKFASHLFTPVSRGALRQDCGDFKDLAKKQVKSCPNR